MAEDRTSNPCPVNSLQGYENEFVNADQKYECPVCLLFMREPHQTDCGHRFCAYCIKKWIRDENHNKKCPVCNESLSDGQVYPDNYTRREILSLTCYCTNKKLGCPIYTTLKQIVLHQPECQYSAVPCPNKCGFAVIQSQLQTHLENECKKRRSMCSICKQMYEILNLEQHKQTCATSENRCRKCGGRLEQEPHECRAQIGCKFSRFGCTFIGSAADMLAHMQQYSQEHMVSLARTLEDLLDGNHGLGMQAISGYLQQTNRMTPELAGEENSAPSTLTSLNTLDEYIPGADVQSLTTDPPANHSAVTAQPANQMQGQAGRPTNQMVYENVELVKAQAQAMEVKPRPRPKLRTPAASFDSATSAASVERVKFQGADYLIAGQDNPQINELCHTVSQQQQHILELRSKVSYLESQSAELQQMLENTKMDLRSRNCEGTFIWRLHNYSRLKEDARRSLASNVLHSPGFYTSFNGYQFCIRLNLTGVESNSTPQLSLFIHLMQSENDDILVWPFSGKVTFTVIDQNEIPRNRTNIVETLIAKPGLAAFQRPTSFRNHRGFGYMEFMRLSQLDNPDSNFIKNDTLIIKVDVKPSSFCNTVSIT